MEAELLEIGKQARNQLVAALAELVLEAAQQLTQLTSVRPEQVALAEIIKVSQAKLEQMEFSKGQVALAELALMGQGMGATEEMLLV